MSGAGAQTRLHPSDLKDLRICEAKLFSGELETECDGSPAWATGDIQGGWSLGNGLDLIVKLKNLTDTGYRFHGSGIAQPGRSVWATVRYRSK